MFTPFEEHESESLNKIGDLAPGIYSEKAERFSDEDGRIEVLLRKFKRAGDESFSVVDALLIDSNKDSVSFQDFVLLKNGNWRSGDGRESAILNDLFPDEFTELRLVEAVDGDVIEIQGVSHDSL